MQQVTYSVLIAAVVFFVLLNVIDVVVGGVRIGSETLMANAFRTVIFAMAYAAIKVAMIIFRGSSK